MVAEHVERKLVAILAADVASYARLAGADEERTLARLRALRSDLIDPTISVHHGRMVKRTGDGSLVEFRSVVDAVRCAIELQNSMTLRNAGLPSEHRIEFRVGIHLGDVVEESDGDLMGDGVNIAARLESIAEPGGICLSEDAWRQVRDRIAESFVDLGDASLKNIARPMRVYAVKPATESAPTAPERPGPPRLSIVVLPFANLGGDPEQEYFVDGVTESLTTDLSRIAGSFVIARNTAFTYKGKPYEVTRIGRELNVRYVLEGSVQRGGSRMRVNVQLIDAATGTHLWAERFEKPVADLFDLQDEVVARLANTLQAQLVEAEARSAEQAPNPDSMDLYFQGMARTHTGLGRQQMSQARDFLERALALDPGNVEAQVSLAWIDLHLGAAYLVDDWAAHLASAEATLTKTLSMAPNHARAHLIMGGVLINTNRMVQAIAECERALALDRNLASAYGYIACAHRFLGHGEKTEAHVNEALRLSPRDTEASLWMLWAGMANQSLGADDEAASWLRRSIETNRNYSATHFWLAGILALLGRHEEAREAVQAGLELDPAFTLTRHRAQARKSNNPSYIAGHERLIEGMRLAGVPEG